jgi:hypothetical protein
MLLRLRIISRRDIKSHILPRLFYGSSDATLKNVCEWSRAPRIALAKHYTPQGIKKLKGICERAPLKMLW